MKYQEGILERDRLVWNACAKTYENRIVGGHPDVLAYEEFEEQLLDRILRFLALNSKRNLMLYDVGCGSGRLHLRYGLKSADCAKLRQADAKRISSMRDRNPNFSFDPLLASKVKNISGIDFAKQMIILARKKIKVSGLGSFLDKSLSLDQGSAFDLQPLQAKRLPVAVCLCNSIGVMQGPEGAIELFKAMRRMVENAGGIAIISAYQLAAIPTHGLNNYESTMDVCGQPRWLEPDTYATPRYVQIPQYYKRCYEDDPTVTVNVYNKEGELIKKDHLLRRNTKKVQKVLDTGRIRTYRDYQSNWYSYKLFEEWIQTHWEVDKAHHFLGKEIDVLRGDPAQIAILDFSDKLNSLLSRLKHRT